MRSLLGPNIMSNTILSYMWMGKLPTTTTQILASVRGFKKKKKLMLPITYMNIHLMHSLINNRQNDQDISQIKK